MAEAVWIRLEREGGMKLYVVEEEYLVDRIRAVARELYKESRLNGDRQRDLAQQLDSVLEAVVEVDDTDFAAFGQKKEQERNGMCRDCKHWSNSVCRKIETDEGSRDIGMEDAVIAWEALDDSGLMITLKTGPMFSCFYFEGRKEKDNV